MKKKVLIFLTKNKLLLIILALYSALLISVIDFGIPNPSHPFPYHMDEWHQLMAVRSLFKTGSSNVLGAANGPLFFFFLSGIFLGPFYLFKIIDPFVIKSSIGSLEEQKHLFEVLRLTSLFFGIGAITLVWLIAKKYLKVNPLVTTLFFTFTPLFIMLSNYFKYDIALLFWILLSVYCLLRFLAKPSQKGYFMSAIFIGCALATKISALPLVPVYFITYVLSHFKKKKRFRTIVYGLGIIIITFIHVGMPDIFFRAKQYYDFFYLNIVLGPEESTHFILHEGMWLFLYTHVYPLTFGHAFYGLFGFSFSYFIFGLLYKKEKVQKETIVVFLMVVFFIFSMLSLKIQAIGNRILVLLPFMAFFVGILYEKLMKIKNPLIKKTIVCVFIFAFFIQVLEVFSWLQIKIGANPRKDASRWIQHTLSRQTIGLENIPIYQSIPDLLLKEFYMTQQDPKTPTRFTYQIIDEKASALPKTIIITNADFDTQFFKDSAKKRLLKRLTKEGYTEIKRFNPSWNLYKYFGSTTDMAFLSLVPLMPISVYQK